MNLFNFFRKKDKKPETGYPEDLMSNVCWAFYGGAYSSEEDFVRAVIQYHTELDGAEWHPNQLVLQSKEVTILYTYWDENVEEEVEEDFSLVADKGFFTAGELLFKIHNKVVENLENDDHHFFEGLSLFTGNNNGTNIPYYMLIQGC
ncbi:MAG: hypothetical protein LBL58_00410 [Tannerellaceae bacterium]|jgi:hypothetical protein|nr:hypothetical protein [Tannerellaceae bacterium]